MIHKKKERRRQVSAFPAIFKADFGLFRHVSAVSGLFRSIGRRPIRPNMADTAQFWPNQPGSVQIKADLTRIESRWHESSRVNVNPRKKKNANADRRAGNHIGCRILCWAASDTGAAPLVLRPCFLVLLQEDYI